MPVSTTEIKTPELLGDGSTTVFSFASYFNYNAPSEVIARLEDLARAYTYPTYTTSPTPSAGFYTVISQTVKFGTAPTSGYKVLIYRQTSLARATDYQDSSILKADVLDADLDKLTMVNQEQAAALNRAIKADIADTVPTLPKMATIAGKYLAIDSTGTQIIGVDTQLTGSWGPLVNYTSTDTIVTRSGRLFKNINPTGNMNQDPLTQPTFWTELTPKIDAWAAGVTYNQYQLVYSATGLIYRSKINGNLAINPDTDLTGSWEPITSTSAQGLDNYFTDELFTGKAVWTGSGATFAINTSSLQIGDNTEGKISGVGYQETSITIPKAMQGEVLEIYFDAYLLGTSPTATISFTDGAGNTVNHNGAVINVTGKARYFAKLNMTSNATLKLRFTLAGTSPDLRLKNLKVGKESKIYGAGIGQETAYTPTTQGLGTPTGLNVKYRIVGEKLRVIGTLTAGTVTASEVQIGLPSGFTSDSSLPTLQVIGHYTQSTAGANAGQILAEASKTYVTVGLQSGTLAGLAKILGTALTTGATYSFEFEVTCNELIGKNVVQLAQSAGPLYLSNTTTTDANDATDSNTTTAIDGGAVPSVTTTAKTKRVVHRALLPNEMRILVFRHAATKTWVPHNTLVWSPAAGLYCSVAIPSEEPNIAANSTGAGILPIDDTHTDIVFLAVASRANGTNYSWATFAAIYDRYEVRIAPQNAVELPPVSKCSGTVTSQAVTAGQVINFSGNIVDPLGAIVVGSGAPSVGWRYVAKRSTEFLIIGNLMSGGNCLITLYKNGAATDEQSHSDGITQLSFSFTISLIAGDYINIVPASSLTFIGKISIIPLR